MIELTPIREDDLAFLNEVRNEAAPEYLHDSRTFTLEETTNWFKNTKPKFWIIWYGGHRIGYFRTSNYSEVNHNIYIGADLHKDFRGKGLAYQSYRKFIPLIFRKYKVNEILLEVLETNHRASNLYKKLGFNVIDVKKESVLKNGVWVDSIVMSLKNSDELTNKIEIVTVNYNTPDLIDNLIKSIRDNEGDYQIRIIDGSDKEPYINEIVEVCKKYDNVVLQQQGWNIHHGRGMDLALSTSDFEWCLLIDSDSLILQPILEKMYSARIGDKKIIGNCTLAPVPGYSDNAPYYHASLLLFNVEYYRELKTKGIGYIHHGAIDILINQYLYENNLFDVVGVDFWRFLGIENNYWVLHPEVKNYYDYGGRTTRSRFGLNLE